MIAIIDKYIPVFFKNLSNINMLIAQIPCNLIRKGFLYVSENPEEKWRKIEALLDKYSDPACKIGDCNFIVFPEDSIPYKYLHVFIEKIDKMIKENTIIIFGCEHVTFEIFYSLLEKYKINNSEAFNIVSNDKDETSKHKPANLEFIIIKDNTGHLHVYIQAKTHPFFGEESVDANMDLYRSKYFYLFRSTMVPFNFMSLICFDFVYRDNYWSNIYAIVKKANQLYFSKRQELDLLIVIECNPKPEHRVFRDTLAGFYGEYLFKTPGTRNTISVFINSSEESSIDTIDNNEKMFGYSHIVLSESFKIPSLLLSELTVDDFNGAPVTRIRFTPKTRLFNFTMNFLRDRDPRSSRVPIKINGVYKFENNKWIKMTSKELLGGEESIYNLQSGGDDN